MELCYNSQTCSGTSTLQRDIQLCRDVGFRKIEIDLSKAEAYLKRNTLDNLSSLLNDHEMECATINAVFGINFCTPEAWKAVQERFNFACQLAQAVGAESVLVLSSERVDLPSGVSSQDIFDDTVQALIKLAETAEFFDVKIAFEPVGTMAIGDVKTAYSIVETIGSEDIGLVLDPFNIFLWDLGSDFDFIRKIDQQSIFMVHINDAENIPFALLDQSHRCMPGDGRIDLAAFLSCVRSTGYAGPFSVEVLNPTIWAKGPDIVIPEAYQKTKAILERT